MLRNMASPMRSRSSTLARDGTSLVNAALLCNATSTTDGLRPGCIGRSFPLRSNQATRLSQHKTQARECGGQGETQFRASPAPDDQFVTAYSGLPLASLISFAQVFFTLETTGAGIEM